MRREDIIPLASTEEFGESLRIAVEYLERMSLEERRNWEIVDYRRETDE